MAFLMIAKIIVMPPRHQNKTKFRNTNKENEEEVKKGILIFAIIFH